MSKIPVKSSLVDRNSQFIALFGDPIKNPLGWRTAKLSTLGELSRGVSKARPRNQPAFLGGKYPLVQTGEITNSGTFITHHDSTYSELGLAQSRLWPKGTLCITIAANIAQTGILSYDACFPDSVVGFITDGTVDSVFLHFWFEFLQKVLDDQATQVAQKNINLKTLSDLQVIIPPMDLQQQFVSFFQQSDKSKFAALNISNLNLSLSLEILSTMINPGLRIDCQTKLKSDPVSGFSQKSMCRLEFLSTGVKKSLN